MRRILALLALLFASTLVMATSIVVNCDAGQSLSQTLSTLNKNTPNTIWVKGTCTELVVIDGFEGLTISGTKGATLQQPSTSSSNLTILMSIFASRSVTISGLAFHSLPSAFSSIGVANGSTNVTLQGLTVDGAWGILAYDASQVFVNGVTVTISGGYAALAAWDKSDVHVKDCSFQRAADSNFYAGITVGSGHVTMQGSTIRDMQQGITVGGDGSVDLVYYDTTSTASDVFINNPAGTNYNGVVVSDVASLNISTAKLHITGAGQSYGSDTGAILVRDNSTLDAGIGSLVISNSHGQGVVVTDNSHANLTGVNITGSAHGGLVIVNQSTATVYSSVPSTTIMGNAVDLFCDSRSQIAGSMNISAGIVQCTNLLSDIYPTLP
jgi:hypothetical protein